MFNQRFVIALLLLALRYANRIERRVIFGKEVYPRFGYKFLVSIQVDGKHQFAGTLINSNTVITVASKSIKAPSDYTVNTHRHDLEKTTKDEGGEVLQVERIINHKQFNATNNLNDISVWKLKGKFIGNIGTIKLDDGALTDNENIGLSVVTAGWGGTEYMGPNSKVLLKAYLKIYNKEECINHFESIKFKFVSENVLCTLNDLGSSACEGDAGSPLLYFKNGKYILVGMVTNSDECDKGLPPVFTRASGYLDFINQNI